MDISDLSVIDHEDVLYNPDILNERVVVTCPVGGYDICPSDEIASTPNPEDVTDNPLGTCRCNGELWVAEGCSFGFVCDDTNPDAGGYLKNCPAVRQVSGKPLWYFMNTFLPG